MLRLLFRNLVVGSEVGLDGGYKVGGFLFLGSVGVWDLFEYLGRDEVERVRKGVRRVLVRGVGWLLGVDESEIVGVE